MAQRDEMLYHAKMTLAAQKNPYGSVEQVFPLALNGFADGRTVGYLGVKHVPAIPEEVVEKLADSGYALHTLDKAAFGGRAVDLTLRNPVTGHPMTGSSSGTAMNVFLHLNDLGVGTDGGGSVLAPALSLNLYGFISPLICTEHMRRYEKTSTDGISFYPSLGLMARTYEALCRGIHGLLKLPAEGLSDRPALGYRIASGALWDMAGTRLGEAPDAAGDRQSLIRFLLQWLPLCDYLISAEGPVDVNGMGDTVYGHFDQATAAYQRRSGKGFLRVANMAGATAVCVPSQALGCGHLLMCESVPEKIGRLLQAAAALAPKQDELIERYFGNLDQYLTAGAFVPQER